MRKILFLLCAVMLALPVVAVGQTASTATDPLTALWAIGGAVVTSAVLGQVKKLDSKIVPVIKPVQPIITAVGAIVAPYLGGLLHLSTTPDLSTLATVGPIGTLLTITAREVYARLKK